MDKQAVKAYQEQQEKIHEDILKAEEVLFHKDSVPYKYGIGMVEADVKSAMSFCSATKFFKFILAVVIACSYFFFPNWLLEILVLATIISLILPLNFFDVFIQKLLEYNTQTIESKQKLDALRTNKRFSEIYEETCKLK